MRAAYARGERLTRRIAKYVIDSGLGGLVAFSAPMETPTTSAADCGEFHPCPVLRMKKRSDVAKEERDPHNRDHWSRRTLPMENHDFEGNSKYPRTGVSLIGMHSEIAEKVKDLATSLSSYMDGTDNTVSISVALDLAIRWLVQHPPTLDWLNGYATQWRFDHKPGRKSPSIDVCWKNNWAEFQARGIETREQFNEYMAKKKIITLRKKREIMETRELSFEEITPIPKEWTSAGKLKIPVDILKAGRKVPAHDET